MTRSVVLALLGLLATVYPAVGQKSLLISPSSHPLSVMAGETPEAWQGAVGIGDVSGTRDGSGHLLLFQQPRLGSSVEVDSRASLKRHVLIGTAAGAVTGALAGLILDANQDHASPMPPDGDSARHFDFYFTSRGALWGAASGAGLGGIVYLVRR